jgi:hypothetical protein
LSAGPGSQDTANVNIPEALNLRADVV